MIENEIDALNQRIKEFEEQIKNIEKISENLRELVRKVDRTAFIQRLLHFWNFKRWLFGG